MTPEQKLATIQEILFPERTKDSEGGWVDHDAVINLSATLYDLRRTQADTVCIQTVVWALQRLYDVRKLLLEE